MDLPDGRPRAASGRNRIGPARHRHLFPYRSGRRAGPRRARAPSDPTPLPRRHKARLTAGSGKNDPCAPRRRGTGGATAHAAPPALKRALVGTGRATGDRIHRKSGGMVPQGRIELPTSPFVPLRLSPPRAGRTFVVWTIPSPAFRGKGGRRPSSLYTVPRSGLGSGSAAKQLSPNLSGFHPAVSRGGGNTLPRVRSTTELLRQRRCL